MQAKSRATLALLPQANGLHERSVKTLMQMLRVYVEDLQHANWDDIAHKNGYFINNSRDSTGKETPFKLVYGCYAHSSLKALTDKMQLAKTRNTRVMDSTNPVLWRRDSSRQQELTVRIA